MWVDLLNQMFHVAYIFHFPLFVLWSRVGFRDLLHIGKPLCSLKQDCMGRTRTSIYKYFASVAYNRISYFCKKAVFIPCYIAHETNQWLLSLLVSIFVPRCENLNVVRTDPYAEQISRICFWYPLPERIKLW